MHGQPLIWPVDQSVTSVILLVGLAVGVDYSMFYLRREREERARGSDSRAGMDYGKPSALPFTGAGITVGAIVIDQVWLAAVAAAVIGLGAVLTRVGWRRGKAPTQR